MKKAFTMIELIFVIVIIGILAAVAIPKLVATRDDAKVTSRVQQITVAMEEISAYAMSHEGTSATFSDMSNAVSSMVLAHKATQIDASTLNIKMNTVSDCIIFTITQNALDTNLTLTYGNTVTDTMCTTLQKIVNTENYSVPLKGVRLKL